MLRGHFLTADMGISGANFIVAETGTTLIVTNEGNGRMTTTLPRVHVAITGIEKVVPTLEDVSTLLRLLPRSATGQSISNYISFTTGTKDAQDAFGAEHFHIILLDAGRTKLIGTDMQEMLRCIRCGACMNHCPVYQNVGGHAYGWVYPGPMGSILTPTYVGPRKCARPAARVHVVQSVRRRVPGQDSAARSHAQAARKTGRARAAAMARAPRIQRVELARASTGALCGRDASWRAHAQMGGRQRGAHS